MKRAAKGGETSKMKIGERAIIYPILVTLVSILIGAGLTYASNKYDQYKNAKAEIDFAMVHPELVKPVMDKLASGEAQLRVSLTKTEPTAQDKLVEAVAEQVKVSK